MIRGPEVLARVVEKSCNCHAMTLVHQTSDRHPLPAKSFTYFTSKGSAKTAARICGGYSLETGAASQCKELSWAGPELSSVSGAPVGDGRLIVAYADYRGL